MEFTEEVILDCRTLRSTCESGHRAGFDGHKRKQGANVDIAVDTLGNLLNPVANGAVENDVENYDEASSTETRVCSAIALLNGRTNVGLADASSQLGPGLRPTKVFVGYHWIAFTGVVFGRLNLKHRT